MTIPDYVLQALERMRREAKLREDAAYQRGWDSATAALVNAANTTRVAVPAEVGAAETQIAELAAANNNRERVTIALRARPGMKGMEVFGWLAQLGFDVKRQSILTVIKRMRKDGEIQSKGSKLYLRSTDRSG